MHPAMKIDRNPEVLSDHLADRSNALHDFVYARRGIDVMEFSASVHLYRAVALRLSLLCGSCDFARTIAANPGIDLDSFTHSAAEQLVSRKTVSFALDVPKSLIDTSHGAHQDGPASVKGAAVQDLPDILDLIRVAFLNVSTEFVNRGRNGVCFSFHHGFTPADEPIAGSHLQEKPARRDLKEFKLGDLHAGRKHLPPGSLSPRQEVFQFCPIGQPGAIAVRCYANRSGSASPFHCFLKRQSVK